jgi:hypothetical protein
MDGSGVPGADARRATAVDRLVVLAIAAAVEAAAYLCAMTFGWAGWGGSFNSVAGALYVATGPALGMAAAAVAARHGGDRPLGMVASVAVLAALCYTIIWATQAVAFHVVNESRHGQLAPSGSMDSIGAAFIGLLAAPFATTAVAWLLRRRLRPAAAVLAAPLGIAMWVGGLWSYVALRSIG